MRVFCVVLDTCGDTADRPDDIPYFILVETIIILLREDLELLLGLFLRARRSRRLLCSQPNGY